MDLSDIVNTPEVHILPLGYTQQQRSLLDMLGRLHAAHVLNGLSTEPILPMEDEMSDSSLYDAFVDNCRQIINHPAMLVDHYMPKNLLLLNTKQAIVRQSEKYHYINELLDELARGTTAKTVVISVTNSREMDLLEAILLGKVGIQYYRFSGSSLYYEKNGMFELNGDSSEKSTPVVAAPPQKTRPRQTVTPAPTRGRGRGRPRGGRGGRVGRPPLNRVTQLHSSDGNSSGDNGTSQSPQVSSGPTTTTKMREEYTQKVSKNNAQFEKKTAKVNLKVYLILSQQLKYLPKLEELKLDLLISLDSNCTNFDAVANTMGKTPILKPLVLNSIEHFEWKLRNLGLEGEEFHRFLTYLTLASFKETKVNDTPSFEEFTPLNVEVAKWILNGCVKKEYPYANNYDTCIPLKLDEELITMVREITTNYKPIGDVMTSVGSPKFTFFQKREEGDIEMTIEVKQEDVLNGVRSDKKVKLNPGPIVDFPSHFTYREYQSTMASQLVQMMKLMKDWMVHGKRVLDEMHLSESMRQEELDGIVVEKGELYKRERDLGVVIDSRGKVSLKSKLELERVSKLLEAVKRRVEGVENGVTGEVGEGNGDNMDSLAQRIAKLEGELSEVEKGNEQLRLHYQQVSTTAADKSSGEKGMKVVVDGLEKQSSGEFIKLKEGAFRERRERMERDLAVKKRENEHRRKYLELLEKVQRK